MSYFCLPKVLNAEFLPFGIFTSQKVKSDLKRKFKVLFGGRRPKEEAKSKHPMVSSFLVHKAHIPFISELAARTTTGELTPTQLVLSLFGALQARNNVILKMSCPIS